MPTRAGWTLLIVGLFAFGAGRGFGLPELYVVGASAAAAVTTALGVRLVRLSKLDLERTVSPQFVAVGEQAHVTLRIANRGRTRSPAVLLADRVVEAGGAYEVVNAVAPLAGRPRRRPARGAAEARYRLTPERRGVVEIGPVRIDDRDALGLARRSRRHALRSRLIVHPPVEALPSARAPSGDDLTGGKPGLWALGLATEDFVGLRSYVRGDDPRHIHWPSTARLDELTVRQFRPPRRGRLAVIIDTRPPGHLEEAQDCTTSAAASVAAAALGSGQEVRIAATDGRTTPVLTRGDEIREVLTFCAKLSGGGRRIVSSEADASGGGGDTAVVAVTAAPSAAANPEARLWLARRLGASLVITCDSRRWGRPEADAASGSAEDWIHLTGPGQLPGLWPLAGSVGGGAGDPGEG